MNNLKHLMRLSTLFWTRRNARSKPKASDESKEPETEKKTLLSDVAGLEEEKEALMDIVDFLKNPDKYAEMGAQTPKCILLVGYPGTGKTLLAKAVANESNVTFVFTKGDAFDKLYESVGPSYVRKFFKKLKVSEPSIIFIDEIDSVGKNRTDTVLGSCNQAVNQLLTEIGKCVVERNVIVLAATSHPENLDITLFDRTIEIDLPDINDRVEILKIHGRNKKFADDVNFKEIAHRTVGFSGEELEMLLNEAALIAVHKQEHSISNEAIYEAMRKLTFGMQTKGREFSEKEKKLAAYHEAGHAVVSSLLPTQQNVKEVSIIPRGIAGGYTWHEIIENKLVISKTELFEELVVVLGGRVAERIVLDVVSTGPSSDLEVATQIAQSMVCVYGMDSEIGPISLVGTNAALFGEETMSLIGRQIVKTIKEAEDDATRILTEHRQLLDMVADTLLEKETISGKELDKIVQAYQNNCTTNV